MLYHQDTHPICALSTASGAGAIAVIRVSGDTSIHLTSKIFSKDLTKSTSHRANFGLIKNKKGEVVDEVLVTVFHKGKSFTGEETTEIACHGSVFIQQEILKLLIGQGCRMAAPGEFTMRAFFNGKMDLSQAEAIADLIVADSKKMHDVAMRQMRGGYSDEIVELKQQLMDFASLIELELDFSEEDVEFASRTELNNLVKKLKNRLEKLTASFAYGDALKNGINTVLAGRPNAGKSTLLNALLNEERAIVSSIAGTTRDTIEEMLQIEGIKFRLIDTAGIREAQDEIEEIGVSRTLSEVSKSQVLLYVFDASQLSKDEVKKDIEKLEREGLSIVLIANKTDLLKEKKQWSNSEWSYPVVQISAKEKVGIDELKQKLYAEFNVSVGDYDTVVVNARHFDAFSSALEDIKRVEEGLESEISGDLLAMDIRGAIRNLSAITGEITTDDLLGNIFANFCIGK